MWVRCLCPRDLPVFFLGGLGGGVPTSRTTYRQPRCPDDLADGQGFLAGQMPVTRRPVHRVVVLIGLGLRAGRDPDDLQVFEREPRHLAVQPRAPSDLSDGESLAIGKRVEDGCPGTRDGVERAAPSDGDSLMSVDSERDESAGQAAELSDDPRRFLDDRHAA